MRKSLPLVLLAVAGLLLGATGPAFASAADHVITVTATARPGESLFRVQAGWYNLDTHASGWFDPPEGGPLPRAEVPSGRYEIIGIVTGSGETVSDTFFDTRVTVGDTDVVIAWDAAAGVRVTALVDRPEAVLDYQTANVVLGDFSLASWMPGADAVYVAPSTSEPTPGLKFSYVPTFFSPQGAKAPYLYHLYFLTEGGLPASPAYTAHDRELAKVRADYHGEVGDRVWRATVLLASPTGAIGPIDGPNFDIPEVYTEYYTAAPYLNWTGYAQIFADGNQEVMSWRPGPLTVGFQKAVWNEGPFGVGFGPAAPYDGVWRDETSLSVNVPMFTGSDPEVVNGYATYPGTGSMELSRDGVPLAAEDAPCQEAVYPVSTAEPGTYTLTCTATREHPTSPLAPSSTATWTFTNAGYDPAGSAVTVGAVRLSSPTVVNGYAPRAGVQAVCLHAYRQPGAIDPGPAREMRFEVSYDDGATWKKVPLLRHGDNAVTALKHPAGAKFVSVRVYAKDAAGNTVTSTTLRSWGLS